MFYTRGGKVGGCQMCETWKGQKTLHCTNVGVGPITVEEVAKRLGVSPATLYRHLPGGRSAVAGQ